MRSLETSLDLNKMQEPRDLIRSLPVRSASGLPVYVAASRAAPFSSSLGMRIERTLFSIRYDQIGFLVIPAITKSKVKRRRIALLIQPLKSGLVMLFEEIDRAEINAKETQAPLVWVEVSQRNSGIVLYNSVAVRENEIADRSEAVFEH